MDRIFIRERIPFAALVMAAVLAAPFGSLEGQRALAAENEQVETTENSGEFSGGSGTAEDPYQVSTAEELDLIHEHLKENFILTGDIDLSGYESWRPIGGFMPKSDAPEDAEIPNPEAAFTGTFDGNGHTIRNITIQEPQSMAVGLFGCVTGTEEQAASIENLTVENADVTGYYLVGGVVGLQFMNCSVENITLAGENQIRGLQGIGGIVGTGFDWIRDCTAKADITVLGDDGACAGIIAGGTTYGSLSGCIVRGGSVTAEGDECWGIGGLCGAPYGASEIVDCQVENAAIRVTGENNRLIGGLTGFAGTYPDSDSAAIENCSVENVSISVSDTTDCVGGIVGGGITETGTDVMSSFTVRGCKVSGSIAGGREYIDNAVGNPEGAQSVDCSGTMDKFDPSGAE